MHKTNKKWIEDLTKLNSEFQKKNPNQEVIKSLFQRHGIKYTQDPVDQMTRVLMGADLFQDRERKKGNNEADI